MVSVRGDVVKVLECLRRGRRPAADCLDRATTLAVKKSTGGRSEIEELPPLAAAILGCLEGSIDEVVRKLTARGVEWENHAPAEFVPDALRLLQRQGLVMSG
jgi:hypothetical protein